VSSGSSSSGSGGSSSSSSSSSKTTYIDMYGRGSGGKFSALCAI